MDKLLEIAFGGHGIEALGKAQSAALWSILLSGASLVLLTLILSQLDVEIDLDLPDAS